MIAPLPQRIVIYGSYLLLGASLVAAVLSAINDALSLVNTPLRALIASVVIVTIWLGAELSIKKYPLRWSSEGSDVRLRGLGIQPRLAAIGGILLLWLPSGVSLFATSTAPIGPNISVLGGLPVHLWEKVPGPDSVTFVNHRLALIVKLQNNTDNSANAHLAILEGCVRIEPFVATDMMIEGETLPKPLIFDETYAKLQESTIQLIRTSGTIRQDSREVRALGTAYVGILFSLPPGRSGAILGVPKSVSTKGVCTAIKNPSSQPSISQLLEVGAIHGEFPRDLAPQLRDGRLKLLLHVGSEVLDLDSSTIGKLHSIRWKNWTSLDLAQMYEVPDSDYPPTSE